MRLIRNILCILGISFTLTSCAEYFEDELPNVYGTPNYDVQLIGEKNASASIYLDEDVVPKQSCNAQKVKFLFSPSKHKCSRLGVIQASGNGYASFDDCINAAKQKAAEVGADIIVLVDSGVTEQYCYDLQIKKPWASFTAWVYSHSE